MNDKEQIANLEQQVQALLQEKEDWLAEKQKLLGGIEQGIVMYPTYLMIERQILNMNQQLHLLLEHRLQRGMANVDAYVAPPKELQPEEKKEKVVKKRRIR